jgi:hypothetical protein
MSAAVLVGAAGRGSATISASPIVQALALASISHVQITGHTMPSAVDVGTARWRNGAIFARVHHGRCGGSRCNHDLAFALASICAVRIHGGTMATAVHL